LNKPNTYCNYVRNLPENDINRLYHDNEYGYKIDSDNELFGRLILEINQAGLSWTTILKKKKPLKLHTQIIVLIKLLSIQKKILIDYFQIRE